MLPLKFRTPTRCQNGHFRWLYWSVKYARVVGEAWSERPCQCPTHEIDEGFEQCDPDQQFTGVLDINGHEIYEGDILRQLPSSKYLYPWIVEFDPEGCSYNLSQSNDYKVIGNIHENPELVAEINDEP